MFRIESEKELRDCFRPIDRDAIELTSEMKFPIYVRDYLSWVEPSGARTYLVYESPDSEKTFGIAFKRNPGRPSPTNFCEWCHSVGASSEIGLLSADASDRRRVGINLCLDLSCVSKLEARSSLTGENSRHLARELVAKFSDFAKRTLF